MKGKLIPLSMLADSVASLSRPIVFTNGVFDILHRGHVEYLAAARALGASLIVGINSDRSAKSLEKGPDRPINSERDRAGIIAALECVSAVILFDDPTPLSLIERIRPDIYVKGGDYNIEELKETALVRSWGGNAQAIAFLPGYSTTSLVHRIRNAFP